MDPLLQLAAFWNQLPAFRAVAESTHLPTAASTLGVTPSAVSRGVKQLEQNLGRQLFRRASRGLQPTPECERFLVALRDGMRRIHQAALVLRDDTMRGPIRIASTGVATSLWVLPAVVGLQEKHPEAEPHLTTDMARLEQRLLTGGLDIAFLSQQIRHPDLATERLGEVGSSVYCGPGHPLHGRKTVSAAELAKQRFIAPPADEHGLPVDGWPAELPRRITMVADRMQLGCEAALGGGHLVVLPDLVAARLGQGQLHRLPFDRLPPTPVFAILRAAIGQPTAASEVLSFVRREFEARG